MLMAYLASFTSFAKMNDAIAFVDSNTRHNKILIKSKRQFQQKQTNIKIKDKALLVDNIFG